MKYFILFIFLISCSNFEETNRRKDFRGTEALYNVMDASGNYKLKRTSGVKKSKNVLFVKSSLADKNLNFNEALEEVIVLSKIGYIKNSDGKKTKILRPFASKFEVWVDGIKNTSKMLINESEKAMEVAISEGRNKKAKKIPFPSTKGLFCFYSQIYECLKVTGFFESSLERRNKGISFQMIWDGYPFIHRQFENVKEKLFETVRFYFDGKDPDGFHKYILSLENQAIFYSIGRESVTNISWVSQGLTIKREQ